MDFFQQLDELSDDDNVNGNYTNSGLSNYHNLPLTTTPPISGTQSQFLPPESNFLKLDQYSAVSAKDDSYLFQGIQSVDVVDTSVPANHSVYTELDTTENASSNITYYSDASSAVVIPTTVLTDKGRSAFEFQYFNKMQSKCYANLYNLDDNCIISSPTGSGKTVLFELAILRLIKKHTEVCNIKILYIAPTKALCLEREKDWASKFASFGLNVGVLTSDTSFTETDNVKKAQIIISTPEKWDLMTRKWTDYSKLFDMIKLLLIDEIHILRENRGSVLEVVVTRMKKICSDIRIIALSATVPNINDVSTWVKLNSHSEANALTMVFGDEYRPVKLQKVVYGYKQTTNDFLFDTFLNAKLVEVLNEHSIDKPVLVFCPTRNSTVSTAKYLSNNLKSIMMLKPSKSLIKDRELAVMVPQGIAYHHAGLSIGDRSSVERNFINGSIKILCSTSTLAVGVNLPAYLVVIKGTKIWNTMQFEEYSELDILQMMGRAGRPQFETEGKAVLMTNAIEKKKYDSLVKGNEKLESKLHLNLPQHLVSEIYLKTITSLEDCITWLKHTFFYARYHLNPTAYSEIPYLSNADMVTRLQVYCEQTLRNLVDFGIIEIKDGQYQSTAYGDAMTRHYIDFDTMKLFLKAKGTQSVSNILLLISKSKEFKTIRLRRNEKKLFRILNESQTLMYPLKTDKKSKNLDNGYEKVYLTIQYELGGQEFPNDPDVVKLQQSFKQDKFFIFKHIGRMARCMVDINLERKDFVSLKNSLLVLRSVNSCCWENLPIMLRQLTSIGLAAVRRFTNHNIRSFQQLKDMEPGKIEYYGGLRPGNGHNIKDQLTMLPVLSISSSFLKAHKVRGEEKVIVKVKIDMDVECQSRKWNGKNININVLSGLSTGEMIDFRRSFVSNILGKRSFSLDFELPCEQSEFQCFISCEVIAGVGDSSTLKLFENLSPNLSKLLKEAPEKSCQSHQRTESHKPNMSLKVLRDYGEPEKADENDDDLDDLLVKASSKRREKTPQTELIFLKNGMIQCKHMCKNKAKCRHLCCREGLPPSKSKSALSFQKEALTVPQREVLPLERHFQKTKSELKVKSVQKENTVRISKKSDQLNTSLNLSSYDLLEKLQTQINPESVKKDLSCFKYKESNIQLPVKKTSASNKRKKKLKKGESDEDSDFDGVMELLKDVSKRRSISSVQSLQSKPSENLQLKRPMKPTEEIINIENSLKSISEPSDKSDFESSVVMQLKKPRYNSSVYENVNNGNERLIFNEPNIIINDRFDNIEEVCNEYQTAKQEEFEENVGANYQHSFDQLLNNEVGDDDLFYIFGSDVDII